MTEPVSSAPASDTPAQTDSVAFVLPCLNEAVTIEWCVQRAMQAVQELNRRHGLSGEVIVADNGSTDGSQQLARAAGARVVDVDRRGYGAALIGGFDATDATYLVMGDSDCSYDFLEGVALVEKLMAGAELCMGSRFKGEIKPGAMPWKNRYIGNPVLSWVLRVLFRTSISDSHCGLRAIRNETYKALNLSSTGMEFASEMVLKSVLRGVRLDEVPVTLSPDGRDRPPHLNPWKDGMRHLVYMFMLSPMHLFVLPALGLLLFGVIIFALLLSAGGDNLARLGPLRFGDHWAVGASAAIVIGFQTAIMGLFALVHSYREGFRIPSPVMKRMLHQSRLQGWLVAGVGLTLLGLFWAALITVGWITSDFGALSQMRNLIAAGTLIVLGAQFVSSGFLMSIMAGNRSSHSGVL